MDATNTNTNTNTNTTTGGCEEMDVESTSEQQTEHATMDGIVDGFNDRDVEESEISEAQEALLLLEAQLRGLEPVGETTPEMRDSLSCDKLRQRNMEIQAEMLWIDMEYEAVLEESNWEIRTSALDEKADDLAVEADEIEHLLESKFKLVGARRYLVHERVLEARSLGRQMWDDTRDGLSALRSHETAETQIGQSNNREQNSSSSQQEAVEEDIVFLTAVAESTTRRQKRKNEFENSLLGALYRSYEESKTAYEARLAADGTGKGDDQDNDSDYPEEEEDQHQEENEQEGDKGADRNGAGSAGNTKSQVVRRGKKRIKMTRTKRFLPLNLSYNLEMPILSIQIRMPFDVSEMELGQWETQVVLESYTFWLRYDSGSSAATSSTVGETNESVRLNEVDQHCASIQVSEEPTCILSALFCLQKSQIIEVTVLGLERPTDMDPYCLALSFRVRVASNGDTDVPITLPRNRNIRNAFYVLAVWSTDTNSGIDSIMYHAVESSDSDRNTHTTNHSLKPNSPSSILGASGDNRLSALYDLIRPPVDTPSTCTPSKLYSQLFPYQQRALSWMIKRETQVNTFRHPLWIPVRFANSKTFYNGTQGTFENYVPGDIRDVAGGILADEMGLGKTVEVIALLLARPMDSGTDLKNAARLTIKEGGITLLENRPCHLPLPGFDHIWCRVKGTLIVTPMGIQYQWLEEIRNHAPHLRVLIYQGRKSKHLLTERELSEYDVVLVTYSVLKSEVHYSKSTPYTFRNRKRYTIPRTPLLHVLWWRVILDEAQMVESAVSASAKMASRLEAVHRWCVTGTPIGKNGLDDLYGLMLFLRLYPYDISSIWNRYSRLPNPRSSTIGPFGNMLPLLKRVMWRYSKKHVEKEIYIPDLIEETLFLTFSPVEEEYYKRALHSTQSVVFTDVRKGKLSDKVAASKLETLRQVCCHPQLSKKILSGSSRKEHVTELLKMGEIAKKMISSAKDDLSACERELCRHLNDLGKVYCREKDLDKAENVLVEAFRIADAGIFHMNSDSKQETNVQVKEESQFVEKVQIVTKNTQVRQWRIVEYVTTGVLLQVKTMKRNLYFESGEYSNEEIHSLETDIKELHRKHEQHKKDVLELDILKRREIENVIVQYEKDILPSWLASKSVTLVAKSYIRAYIEEGQIKFRSRLPGMHRLHQDLTKHLSICTRVESISSYILYAVSALHLCLCIDSHQGRLHHLLMGQLEDRYSDSENKECPGDKEEETDHPLRGRYALGSHDHLKQKVQLWKTGAIKAASSALKELSLHSQEHFQHLSRLLRPLLDPEASKNRFALDLAIGHLHHCRVNNDRDLANWISASNSVRSLRCIKELYALQPKLELARDSEKASAEQLRDELVSFPSSTLPKLTNTVQDLRRASISKQNHVTYLNTKFQHLEKSNATAGKDLTCPICRRQMHRLALTWCGHEFCRACILPWIARHRNCPTCRHGLTTQNIMEVLPDDLHRHGLLSSSLGNDRSTAIDAVPIVGEGEYGTKVENLIKCLKYIETGDPGAKSLVFSQFAPLLEYIGDALQANGIPYIYMSGNSKDMATKMRNFQKGSSKERVLLLSLRKDNSGRTLVAATHVFLLEPSLNAAVESQAINRVHRIGQTKRTYVHRMIVRNSIEERIARDSRTDHESSEHLHRQQKEDIGVSDLLRFLDIQREPDAESSQVVRV